MNTTAEHLPGMGSPVVTLSAPAAIGPYSQGMVFGNLVFTSGQIPLDPATGRLVEGDLETQVRRVFINLQGVLEAAGSGLHHALKVTVFLKDLEDFRELNRIYAEVFGQTRPARSTVQVARLPMDARVEIEVVAAR